MSYSSSKITAGKSSIHGLGCMAAGEIQAGEIVGVFAGQIYVVGMQGGQPVYPGNVDQRYCVDMAVVEQGGLCLAVVLDPVHGGKTAIDRINHSSNPNCVVCGVGVIAGRRIRRGEELTIHYGELDATPFIDPASYSRARGAA